MPWRRMTMPRSFANTMLALENSTENLDYALSVVRHLESVATTPELRAAWNVVEPEASAFYSQIPLNEGIWKQLRAYAETDEAKALAATRRRFLTKTLDSFKRHGAELDPAGKKRMAEIDVELTRVTTKFSENVLDSTNAFELIITDEAKLAGLPPSAIAAARQNAEIEESRGLAIHAAGAELYSGVDLSRRPRDPREDVSGVFERGRLSRSGIIVRCWHAFWSCARRRRYCWAFRISRTSCCTIAWRTKARRRCSFWRN